MGEPGDRTKVDATAVDAPSYDYEYEDAPSDTRVVPVEGTEDPAEPDYLHRAAPRTREPPTQLRVHDDPAPDPAASARRRRRERDARTEKFAQRAIPLGFVAVGAVALALVNGGVFDDVLESPPSEGGPLVVPSPTPTAPVLKAAPDETADLPALASLEREGLTIVAEGLPEIVALDPARPPEILVGIESCRHAWGVWEFSPNKRFRFLSTCQLMQDEILAGAWLRDGSSLLLSPITSGGGTIELLSRFRVEKPSSMETDVTIRVAGVSPVRLRVRQRITGLRAGMEGERTRGALEPKNTVRVRGIELQDSRTPPRPGASPGAAPTPSAPAAPRDPVLDLLEGG